MARVHDGMPCLSARLNPLEAVILVVAEPLQHSPFSGSFSHASSL